MIDGHQAVVEDVAFLALFDVILLSRCMPPDPFLVGLWIDGSAGPADRRTLT